MRENHTFHVTMVQCLRNWPSSLSVELFRLQMERRKKEKRLRFVGSFAKVGWKLWRSEKGMGLHRLLKSWVKQESAT